jgi:hypothetical protein
MNEPPTGLLVIDLPLGTFSLWVVRGLVADCPPAAFFTLGWSAGRAVQYFENRGARVNWDPPLSIARNPPQVDQRVIVGPQSHVHIDDQMPDPINPGPVQALQL